MIEKAKSCFLIDNNGFGLTDAQVVQVNKAASAQLEAMSDEALKGLLGHLAQVNGEANGNNDVSN